MADTRIYNLEAAFAYIAKFGVLKPNRYFITFSRIPLVVSQKFGDVDRNEQARLRIACEAVDLPAKTILTDDLKVGKHIRKSAFAYTVDPIKLTFRCSSDAYEKRFFDLWLDTVCNPLVGSVDYHDNISGELTIDVLDDDANIAYSVTLYEVYPTNVSASGLSFATTNDTIKVDVQLAFTRFAVNYELSAEIPQDIAKSPAWTVPGKPLEIGLVPAAPPDAVDTKQFEIATLGSDAKQFLQTLGLESTNVAFDWNNYLADPNQWGTNNSEEAMQEIMRARGDILSEETKAAIAGDLHSPATAQSAVDILTDQAGAVLSTLERLSVFAPLLE